MSTTTHLSTTPRIKIPCAISDGDGLGPCFIHVICDHKICFKHPSFHEDLSQLSSLLMDELNPSWYRSTKTPASLLTCLSNFATDAILSIIGWRENGDVNDAARRLEDLAAKPEKEGLLAKYMPVSVFSVDWETFNPHGDRILWRTFGGADFTEEEFDKYLASGIDETPDMYIERTKGRNVVQGTEGGSVDR